MTEPHPSKVPSVRRGALSLLRINQATLSSALYHHGMRHLQQDMAVDFHGAVDRSAVTFDHAAAATYELWSSSNSEALSRIGSAEVAAAAGDVPHLQWLAHRIYSAAGAAPCPHSYLRCITELTKAGDDLTHADLPLLQIGHYAFDRAVATGEPECARAALRWYVEAFEVQGPWAAEAAASIGILNLSELLGKRLLFPAAAWFMRVADCRLPLGRKVRFDVLNAEESPVAPGVGWHDPHLLGEMLSELTLSGRRRLMHLVSRQPCWRSADPHFAPNPHVQRVASRASRLTDLLQHLTKRELHVALEFAELIFLLTGDPFDLQPGHTLLPRSPEQWAGISRIALALPHDKRERFVMLVAMHCSLGAL